MAASFSIKETSEKSAVESITRHNMQSKCSLTYGFQIGHWRKISLKKMEICQRKKERKMLGIKLIDKMPNLEIREKTKVNDILEEITKLKWK